MVYDVVVVGGGQAGLAMGYYLKQSTLNFIILDNSSRTGDVWRKRYDSLVLFTPRSYSALPGLALAGEPEGFPAKDEIADYLERYAQTFDLPIKHHCHVQTIQKENGLFIITTAESQIQSKKVVLATGPFHKPNIPPFSSELSKHVIQLHSSEYINPGQLKEGTVLVVGGGNSGAQIAVELSDHHNTCLSVGQKLRFLPLTVVGKSIFWCFDKLGLLQADRNSRIGKKVHSQPDPIFGFELKEKLKNNRISLKGRTKSVHKNEIQFEDSSAITVQNVIWATGFKQDYSWVEIPDLFDHTGKIKQDRGVTEIEGLYFLGLPWQHRRGSALLLGVGDDAQYIYNKVTGQKLVYSS